MHLKILLPFKIFLEVDAVTRVVVRTASGSFGILPRRQSCATALVPGLLSYGLSDGTEQHVAVDEGILTKTGPEVVACVRAAVTGSDLPVLQRAVEDQFLRLSEDEELQRTALAELEGGFVRRLLELQRGGA